MHHHNHSLHYRYLLDGHIVPQIDKKTPLSYNALKSVQINDQNILLMLKIDSAKDRFKVRTAEGW